MKKIIFAIAVILLALTGALHTTWYYFHIANETFTSFPAQTAFLLLIPYALAIVVCLVIGLIVLSKKR